MKGNHKEGKKMQANRMQATFYKLKIQERDPRRLSPSHIVDKVVIFVLTGLILDLESVQR